MSVHIQVVTALLIIGILTIYFRRPRNILPLPPGPKSLPFIGNIHQAPKDYAWRQFHEWTKQYGSIFRLQFGKDTIIVLGSYESAHALLDRRSANFSSRPYLPMAGENLTRGLHLLLRPYDENYKLHQRMEAPLLTLGASRKYATLQDMESCCLINQLLRSNEFVPAIHRYAASIAYSLVYGQRIVTGDEQELKTAHVVQEHLVECMKQGDWIVDALPFLNRLPQWLAPWKKLAEGYYQLESKLHRDNLRNARRSPSWNFSKALSASKEAREMSEVEFSYNLGVLCDASLDTTGQTLEMFVLAAVKNPEAVRVAQKELDTVIGRDRLPEFEDMKELPYIDAFIKELLRWRPIIIGGVPHSNLEDDVYNGYYIPKNSIIIGSHWSIHMDPVVYGDPESFRPERWLQNPNLPNVAFGFGRRVCSGQHIARQSLFYAISRILWAFDIEKGIDEEGNKIDPDDMALTDFFVVRPLPFKARFQLRDARVRGAIGKKWNNSGKDVGVLLDAIRAKWRH
jgi:cytochrome P450